MPTSFDVDKDVGTDALNVAHQIRGFLEEKTGDAEILRKESDRPLVRSGSTEVVVVDRGNRFEVTFSGADFGQQDLMDAIGKLKVTQTVRENRDSSKDSDSFEFGEERDSGIAFEVVKFRGQTAIVRKGVKRKEAEVLAVFQNIIEAVEFVAHNEGVRADQFSTVLKKTRTQNVNVNPVINPLEVPEASIIAAVQTPGLAYSLLNVSQDDPNMEFNGVGSPDDVDFVVKPFTKEEARYKKESDPDFEDLHPKCKDCAHFDGHGNCLIVPNIRAEEYCEEFYADVGVFGVGRP